MNSVNVVNIKCEGCAGRIKSGLSKQGLSNIQVDAVNQTVSFDGDPEAAKQILNNMGYPEAGSPTANSLGKKAKSYVSCMIGRASK